MTDEDKEHHYRVEMLARVEGEGRFSLRVRDGEVVDASLSIFEAPRFFEAFLRGRDLHEVPDITARICGICPIAYQTGSTQAMERALGIELTPEIRALRRLIYCGEWIESHTLHVFMLHAPDFLGYHSALDMAKDHRALVERGLRIKKVGNRLMEVLGGRSVHPVSVRVGGFTRAPTVNELRALEPELEAALAEAIDTVTWTASLECPDFESDAVFLTLAADDAYPIERGDRILTSDRGEIPIDSFLDHVEEIHVEHSNALQARFLDGTPYLTGPLARLNLCSDKLHPTAAKCLADSGLTLPVTNPYQSLVVRSIEIVQALADALDIVRAYRRAEPSFLEGTPRDFEAVGASEAPRGLCWHRYRVDAAGKVVEARIIPPTSQNQARIEEDLRQIAADIIALPHDEATLRCEQLIRSYDPCISCATHFLRLEIEEV